MTALAVNPAVVWGMVDYHWKRANYSASSGRRKKEIGAGEAGMDRYRRRRYGMRIVFFLTQSEERQQRRKASLPWQAPLELRTGRHWTGAEEAPSTWILSSGPGGQIRDLDQAQVLLGVTKARSAGPTGQAPGRTAPPTLLSPP